MREWRLEDKKKQNEELIEMFGEPGIVAQIKNRRLRWSGHVGGKPAGRLPQKLYELILNNEFSPGTNGEKLIEEAQAIS